MAALQLEEPVADYESIQASLSRVLHEVTHSVDEPSAFEVERSITEHAVSRELLELQQERVDLRILLGGNGLGSG